MKERKPWTDYTLNKESVEKMEYASCSRFINSSFFMLATSFLCGTLFHLFGWEYSFFGPAPYIEYSIVFLLYVLTVVLYCKECFKSHIFKKSYYAFVLPSACLILLIEMGLAANYTTVYHLVNEKNQTINMNWTYYFCVFLPIIIIMIFLDYYASGEGIKKQIRRFIVVKNKKKIFLKTFRELEEYNSNK